MFKRNLLFILFFLISCIELFAQPQDSVSVVFLKKQISTTPGKIINVTFFIKNSTNLQKEINEEVILPAKWNIINHTNQTHIKPHSKVFSIYSIQVPANYRVGKYNIVVNILNSNTKKQIVSSSFILEVTEIEKIIIKQIQSPEHVVAGEIYTTKYFIQNQGNTTKRLFLETRNCKIKENAEIKLEPNESAFFTVEKQTSPDITDSRRESYTVRAYEASKLQESVFQSILVFPKKNAKKDPFFRFPIAASVNYLATNQNEKFAHSFQYQVAGKGSLDTGNKHKLRFLARGPSNTDLSYLGLYDQYYISYENKNLFMFVGEQSYSFTPLTEMSRFGAGVESRVLLNNGLSVGFLYVKPRYFLDIRNEYSAYSIFNFNKYNAIGIHFIQKNTTNDKPVTLTSITSRIKPFKKTTLDLELSTGKINDKWDNAIMANINSQFSIFQLSANYSNAGKYYPGYYNNSVFYNGNISAKVSEKVSIGVYGRQDFANAQLDTFFVTAPYTKSIRTSVNYNIGERAYLMFYWRNFERKDRLSNNKFHYKTKSLSAEFNHRVKKIDYMILAEYGKTINLLLEPGENEQLTYRGATNIAYHFNSFNSVKVFGSYSNVNSFVSSEQRNVTAGFAFNLRLWKNLFVDFYYQNAYDIDYYYRNRNLLQFDLNYNFLRNHSLSFRSFYTIFKEQVEDPEFNVSLTYSYKFGIPVKRLIKSGGLGGRITKSNGEPFPGLIIYIRNKSAITDNNGEFRFKSVQPGNYIVSIDRSKLDIDEIINIPSPVKVEIFENQTSTLNFKIIKGAKFEGKFIPGENNRPGISNLAPDFQHIIIELKSSFKSYRIIPDKYGNFSFPVLQPGEWIFRIIKSSVPTGFTIKKTVYNLNLKSGEEFFLNIEINPKIKHIIFKPSKTLTTVKQKKKVVPPSPDLQKKSIKTGTYYSVQIGAFKNKLKPGSRFFKGEKFYFEKEINNLHKYFIGKFDTLEKAKQEKKRLDLKFKNTIIVTFKNNSVL
jgi:hypothetical protein